MPAAKNPKNRWAEKDWRDAIRVAVNRKQDGSKRLFLLADKLVDAGLAGDVQAMREIGDRLDGKPAQTIEATIDDQRSVVRAPAPSEDATSWRADFAPVAKPH